MMREAPDQLSRARPWHIGTIAVEDYFHTAALSHLIEPQRWTRFEGRVERNTRAALDLLDEFGLKLTFFVLGWVAEQLPEIVREIADRGHEVASKGYWHRTLHQRARTEFREDLVRSREILERIIGRRIAGHRIARGSFGVADLWALEVLAEEGFAYDSSVYPQLRSIAGEPWRRFLHQQRFGDRELWEVPLSSLRFGRWHVPVAGGNYLRQLPLRAATAIVSHWERRHEAPFVLYFHIWELDPELPRISAAGPLTRLRQYRNLHRMETLLRRLFERHAFHGIANHLGIEPQELARDTPPLKIATVSPAVRRLASGEDTRTAVTVIVPCHNEEMVLPYLARTLESVGESLNPAYQLRYVFVDDGSRDRTWDTLGQLFGGRSDCELVRHTRNRGVAAAIMTGIEHAKTEVVCSIDCDCTYDPHQLQDMIPRLRNGVDLVTGSPYHRLGSVRNVPGWRLALSKSLSALYRLVLHHRLATYTSCFRVYRRSAVVGIPLERGGFLGITELLGELDLRGACIVEQPAVLEVRLLGRSKMKLIRTIGGHLRLLLQLAGRRVRRAWTTDSAREKPSA